DVFFFASGRRLTRSRRDWSSDVCSSDLRATSQGAMGAHRIAPWLVARGYATPATAVPAPAHIARETTEERLRALEAAVAAISVRSGERRGGKESRTAGATGRHETNGRSG